MAHTPAVPAGCEISDCGVLAVGRCIDCGKAFCASHQARTPPVYLGSGGTAYSDLCAEDYRTRQEQDARRSVAQAAAAKGSDQEYVYGTAGHELRSSSAPTVPIYTLRERIKYHWWKTGATRIPYAIPGGRAFLIGYADWSWTSTTYRAFNADEWTEHHCERRLVGYLVNPEFSELDGLLSTTFRGPVMLKDNPQFEGYEFVKGTSAIITSCAQVARAVQDFLAANRA